MKKILLSSTIALSLIVGSCSRQVTRVAPETVIDLSGRWNDVDSKLVAEELTKQLLGERWLLEFTKANPGKKPVIICGFVKNKSSEHIEAETFIKNIERAFINSGLVKLVQGGEKREEIRGERADQQNNSSKSTMKKFGLEMGADYMLQGDINSIIDSYKKDKVVFYQVNLELSHMQTNEVVWIGEKKIKKTVHN